MTCSCAGVTGGLWTLRAQLLFLRLRSTLITLSSPMNRITLPKGSW